MTVTFLVELVPCLRFFVSSLKLLAFEHHKLMYLQTLSWLPGEGSLPIGLLVILYLFLTLF